MINIFVGIVVEWIGCIYKEYTLMICGAIIASSATFMFIQKRGSFVSRAGVAGQ
jgi:hypothetical protein